MSLLKISSGLGTRISVVSPTTKVEKWVVSKVTVSLVFSTRVMGSTVLECDSLTVNTGTESFNLPQKEFMLLYKMASYPGKIFTRQQLMDEIWGYDSESDTHTVDVHIGRLRERFRDSNDFRIVTMRGVGYKVVRQ